MLPDTPHIIKQRQSSNFENKKINLKLVENCKNNSKYDAN